MPNIRFWFFAVLSAAVPRVAAAQSVDIAALIECNADARAWGALAFPLMEGPAAAEAMGWNERASDNPFLKEYDLAAPIGVFGRSTSRIAVTATGPLAVLDGVEPAALAAELGVTPTIATPEKFLGEKVVMEVNEAGKGMSYRMRITLNVSTVDTHPGLTLAGCSYVVETSSVE